MESSQRNISDVECLSAKHEGSFAYLTVRDRLPIIITKIIDHLHREKDNIAIIFGEEAKNEVKRITGSLSKLKNELQTDKPAIPISNVTTSADIEIWNNYLENLSNASQESPSWFKSPWLFMENYMYRRIREAFETTKLLTNYDPFQYQKQEAFTNSLSAIEILGNCLTSLPISMSSDDLYSYFNNFLQVSLWGNRCDLSVSAGSENSQKEDPLAVLNSLQANILVNDSLHVWSYLQQTNVNKQEVTLAYVLDNAGYELFSDLCFADFLCSNSLVSNVHFFVKCIPWYVSDTTEEDFLWLLNSLANSENPNLQILASKWQQFIDENTWVIEKEIFWTLPHDFSEMKKDDINLYRKLGELDLIVFKGDLNYRKLTGDRQWIPTTSFEVALRGFNPSPLFALRTLKADTIVGLQPGQAEKIEKNNKNWMITGEFAVVQFCDLILK